MFNVRRVYEERTVEEGKRVLAERKWPRGLGRDEEKVDLRLPDLGPSDRLVRWFSHDEAKWEEFRERYFAELRDAMIPSRCSNR